MEKTDIAYKALNKGDLLKYKEWLLELIDSDDKRNKEIWRSLKKSSLVIVALDWDKIIWLNQVISDLYFSAVIINLLVHPEYRRQGIGWWLMQKTLQELLRLKVKNIELVVDPSNDWFPNFYEKFGFVESRENGVHMSLDKEIFRRIAS